MGEVLVRYSGGGGPRAYWGVIRTREAPSNKALQLTCEITDRAGHPAIICLDDGQGGPNDQRSTRNSSQEAHSQVRRADREHQQGLPVVCENSAYPSKRPSGIVQDRVQTFSA